MKKKENEGKGGELAVAVTRREMGMNSSLARDLIAEKAADRT